MKRINVFLLPVILISYSLLSFMLSQQEPLIKWRKIDTEQKARTEMDKLILPASDFDTDFTRLSRQKNEWLSAEGDSLIFFHSPYVAVHPLSMVARKWMYTFRFREKKLTGYSVERGLLGP